MPGGAVWGRQAELAAASDFLAMMSRSPAVLTFAGEPGIGKSTIWHAATELAREREIGVLQCRAAPAEARLTYVSLADLLAPVGEAVLAVLPDPQRRAIEVGLLRADPAADAGIGQRVMATAFLSVLRELASAAPLLIAVDDVQWLDAASKRVLVFALRRLATEPVGLLGTIRSAQAAAAREVVAAVPAGQASVAAVGRLDSAAIKRILDARLGRPIPRPMLMRIVSASGGNPLFAIEIGRALLERPAGTPGGVPPPIPEDLRTLLLRRVRRLPAGSQRALLTAAAQFKPKASAADVRALEPAERAGLVTFDRGQVVFTHPLVASAIYGSASGDVRRGVHRKLAESAGGQEEQARHLALGADGPSEEIAAALTDAARLTRSRGAPDAAADLLELAVSMTTDDHAEQRLTRVIAAAESHFHAGNWSRARALAAEVASDCQAGLAGRALRLLGMISYHEDSYAESVRLFQQAVDRLRDDPLVVDLHVNLAHVQVSIGDSPAAAREAAAALTQARRFGDKPFEAIALAVAAMVDLFVGKPADWDRVDEALLAEDLDRHVAIQVRPTWLAGAMRLYCDQLGPARAHLTVLRQRLIERGEESDLPFLSFHLATVERLAGQIAVASRYAEEAYELAGQLGSRNLQLLAVSERCFVRCQAGDVAGARADARQALALANDPAHAAYPAGAALAGAANGFLALSVGDLPAAAAMLEPIAAGVELTNFCHPVAAWYLPDAIEAFTAMGWLDRADGLIALLRRTGRVAGRPNVDAVASRCRAHVLAARADLTGAADAVADALTVPAELQLPLDLGRTLLLKGQLHRRARQKLLARQALTESLEAFDRLGAPLWAEKARAELARVAGRSGQAAGELTATEERVAKLAATGLTNREVADRVFLSPKTVEVNMARIYRKLGIRSRAELGALMRDRGGAGKA